MKRKQCREMCDEVSVESYGVIYVLHLNLEKAGFIYLLFVYLFIYLFIARFLCLSLTFSWCSRLEWQSGLLPGHFHFDTRFCTRYTRSHTLHTFSERTPFFYLSLPFFSVHMEYKIAKDHELCSTTTWTPPCIRKYSPRAFIWVVTPLGFVGQFRI